MLAIMMFLLMVTSFFMVVLVLIQRGRGGGLAGAFGGMGGQSAFGTKAGDLFTKITIGVALFWIVLCIASIKVANTSDSILAPELGRAAGTLGGAGQAPAGQAPAGDALPPGQPPAEAPPAEAPPAAATPPVEAPPAPAPPAEPATP